MKATVVDGDAGWVRRGVVAVPIRSHSGWRHWLDAVIDGDGVAWRRHQCLRMPKREDKSAMGEESRWELEVGKELAANGDDR